jgi:hypothetical protein
MTIHNNLKLAKSLFMRQQLSPQQIEHHTGIPQDTLQLEIYAPNGWLAERSRSDTTLITEEEYELVSPILITDAKARTLSIIRKGLTSLEDDGKIDQMTAKDVKDVTDIFASLDKIDRLDKGKATSITGVDLDRYDAKEVVAARRSRSDYIDAEFTEAEEDS